MANKVKITDEQGTQVFPITHVSAVIDSNGNSVEQVLGAQTDLINQKQMEIGAVPSDLTPTKNSSNWVTSGGIFDKVYKAFVADINITKRKNYIKSNGVWSNGGYHILLHVDDYDYVKLEANNSCSCNYAFLTGTETTGSASLVSGTSRNDISAGNSATYQIPVGAIYLYIVLGATDEQTPSSVVFYKSIEKDIDDVADEKVDKQTVFTSAQNMSVSGLLKPDGSVISDNNTSGYRTTDFIAVDNTMILNYNDVFSNGSTYCGLLIYNANKTVISTPTVTGVYNYGIIDFSTISGAAYVRFSTNMSTTESRTPSTKCILKYKVDMYGVLEELKPILNGANYLENYGCTVSSSSSSPTNILWMTSTTPCTKSGIVKTVGGVLNSSGTLTIAIGFIDQNNYMIIDREYGVNFSSSSGSVNVENLGISIKEGEYLLAKVSGNCYPRFGVNESVTPKGLSVNGAMQAEVRSDNVYFSFYWTVNTEIPSHNEMAELVVEQQTEISSLREEINTPKPVVIVDEVTGTPYKVVIRNGQIVLQPNIFTNVLVLGNSITTHGLTSIWPANNRGMAATKPEYDFCGIIETQLKEKDNTATVTRLNIADWERDFSTSLSTLIGNNLTAQTDLVVIRLGENVTNTSGFETALGNLVSYVYSVAPNVRIVVTGMYWANSTKENILKNVADNYGLDFVKIDQYGIAAYEEATGHYTYNTDFTAISEITNSGVAQHPSNIGMCAIANEILGVLGCEKSTNRYALQSVTVDGVTGSMYVLQQ